MIVVVIEGKKVEFDKRRMKVAQILQELGLLKEEVLVFKDNVPLTEDEFVIDGEKIKILRVLSRG